MSLFKSLQSTLAMALSIPSYLATRRASAWTREPLTSVYMHRSHSGGSTTRRLSCCHDFMMKVAELQSLDCCIRTFSISCKSLPFSWSSIEVQFSRSYTTTVAISRLSLSEVWLLLIRSLEHISFLRHISCWRKIMIIVCVCVSYMEKNTNSNTFLTYLLVLLFEKRCHFHNPLLNLNNESCITINFLTLLHGLKTIIFYFTRKINKLIGLDLQIVRNVL